MKQLKSINKSSDWHPKKDGNRLALDNLAFNRLCFLMEGHTTQSVKDLSISEFYSLRDFIEEKSKKNGRK